MLLIILARMAEEIERLYLFNGSPEQSEFLPLSYKRPYLTLLEIVKELEKEVSSEKEKVLGELSYDWNKDGDSVRDYCYSRILPAAENLKRGNNKNRIHLLRQLSEEIGKVFLFASGKILTGRNLTY